MATKRGGGNHNQLYDPKTGLYVSEGGEAPKLSTTDLAEIDGKVPPEEVRNICERRPENAPNMAV